MHETALLVTDRDVEFSIPIQITGGDRGSHPRIAVDFVWHEVDPILSTHGSEPVDDRGILTTRILAPVGKPALAGNDVLQLIPVHVFQCDAVQLAEREAVRRFRGLATHDQVPLEGDGTLAVLLLLEPGEPPGMRGE